MVKEETHHCKTAQCSKLFLPVKTKTENNMWVLIIVYQNIAAKLLKLGSLAKTTTKVYPAECE